MKVSAVKFIRGKHPEMATKTQAAEAAEQALAAKAAAEQAAAEAATAEQAVAVAEKAALELAEKIDQIMQGDKEVKQARYIRGKHPDMAGKTAEAGAVEAALSERTSAEKAAA